MKQKSDDLQEIKNAVGETIGEIGSGNVFADLGLPDPEERLLKAQVAAAINDILARKGWTQVAAAHAVGLSQPKISDLRNGRLAGFSMDRLLAILQRLGRSVELRIADREIASPQSAVVVGSIRRSATAGLYGSKRSKPGLAPTKTTRRTAVAER